MRRETDTSPVTKQELIEVLSAIAVITKDLTRKLMKTQEGGQSHGKSQRTRIYHPRTSRL